MGIIKDIQLYTEINKFQNEGNFGQAVSYFFVN